MHPINTYCFQCKKRVKAENYPEHLGVFSIVLRILGAILFLIIPFIGWIISIILIVTIFTSKKNKDDYYCTECGTLLIKDNEVLNDQKLNKKSLHSEEDEREPVKCSSCGRIYKVYNIHINTMCPYCQNINKGI